MRFRMEIQASARSLPSLRSSRTAAEFAFVRQTRRLGLHHNRKTYFLRDADGLVERLSEPAFRDPEAEPSENCFPCVFGENASYLRNGE